MKSPPGKLMNKAIKVAIVEDDEYIRNSLSELVNGDANLDLAGAYEDGTAALAGIRKSKPDVVMMDIQLPDVNGVECVRELKAALPDVNFLMLTAYEDSDKLFESLKAGASGYLLKRTSSTRLLQAIRELNDGGSPMTPQIARRVVGYFSGSRENSNSELVQLTAGQKKFLDELAQGYSYKEIADHLGISMDGVRSYIRKIYEKLHVHSRTEAVVKYLHH
ncbi:MAG TPA: response regulator transcription factor [Candidatus Sulfotelmatobacter sp.]|nr:response regulator transcription factor [Candidatus Sulfotelmatobacter sp.]